jgi:4-coumarate--CoA ligase
VVYQLQDTGARAMLVHPAFLPNALEAAKQVNLPTNKIFLFSDTPQPATSGIQDFRTIVGTAEEADSYRIPEFSPEEARRTIATINYSSGTTGLPKGVMISHSALLANTAQAAIQFCGPEGPDADERWVGCLPLYHAFGQLFSLGQVAKLRIPIYIMKAFVLADFLSTIEKHKINTFHVPPPIIIMLLKRPEVGKYDLSSVRKCLCAAAPLSKELQLEVGQRFGWNICQGYGMTECTCGAIAVPSYRSSPSNIGSVGVPFPNTEIGLFAFSFSDSPSSFPSTAPSPGEEITLPNTQGEVYIRGPQNCLGYWKNEKATKDTLTPDGWLKTGDVGVRDEQGNFYIVDRKKELIKHNGLQVAPAELEAALLLHPSIADAAVVGVSLLELGNEFPRAYVVVKEDAKGVKEEDVVRWLAGRVAKHKGLSGGVLFVDVVPKLASGKIMRRVLREWAKRDEGVVRRRVGSRL